MHIFRKHHFDQVLPQNSCRAEQPVENQIQRPRRLAHSDLCLRHWRKVPSTRFASLSVYPFRDVFGVSYLIHQSCENKCKNSDLNTNWYQKDNDDKHYPTVFFRRGNDPFRHLSSLNDAPWHHTHLLQLQIVKSQWFASSYFNAWNHPQQKLHHITQELLNTKYVVPLVLLISMTSMTIS